MNLLEIINKTIINFLNEEYYDDYNTQGSIYESYRNVVGKMIDSFLYKNNSDMSKPIPWTVIPFYRIKKIWEDYIKNGIVRDVKGLELIESIIYKNILKIWAITELWGHTESYPDDNLEDNFSNFVDGFLKNRNKPEYAYLNKYYSGNYLEDEDINIQKEKLVKALMDKFEDYTTDSKTGHTYITDYGLKPLQIELINLIKETVPEKKLTIIDKILNIVHQRSDLASWFIEGGSNSLNQISGYGDEEGNSTLSKKYNLYDYK